MYLCHRRKGAYRIEYWSDKYEILSVHIDRPVRDDIDPDRLLRDYERINIEHYDIVLNNDSDLESFLKTAVTTIATFIA